MGERELTLRSKVERLIRMYKLLHRLAEVETPLHDRFVERESFEMLKSHLEVSPELIEEFQQWKAATPIPARPLVSVCVCTHNRARLLIERCVPSILSQTYPDLELIVVGDGCTDETAALAAEIKDPRFRFVNLSEQEIYPTDPRRRWMVAGTSAFNRALSMARGDFVTHLDDDDEYLPERLEKLVAFAQANECDFVWHPFWVVDPAGRRGINDARELAYARVTTSSVFYRSWFTRVEFSSDSHLLLEPGDWNWVRRVKYIGPACMRYPQPLHIKHETAAQVSRAILDGRIRLLPSSHD